MGWEGAGTLRVPWELLRNSMPMQLRSNRLQLEDLPESRRVARPPPGYAGLPLRGERTRDNLPDYHN